MNKEHRQLKMQQNEILSTSLVIKQMQIKITWIFLLLEWKYLYQPKMPSVE